MNVYIASTGKRAESLNWEHSYQITPVWRLCKTFEGYVLGRGELITLLFIKVNLDTRTFALTVWLQSCIPVVKKANYAGLEAKDSTLFQAHLNASLKNKWILSNTYSLGWSITQKSINDVHNAKNYNYNLKDLCISLLPLCVEILSLSMLPTTEVKIMALFILSFP